MNRLTNNIPNKIKQPAQCCVNCGKSYIKRANLDKHLVICDLLQRSKKKTNIIIEEDEPMPSQRKMFEMLIELGQKYSRLEEKIDEINKWVVKKKKKINVLEWLNTNVKPDVNFDNILDKIIINEDDVNNILQNSFYDVLNEVFARTIYIFKEFTDWKKIKANEIKTDSTLSSICDKTLVKMMSVEFKQESILSKVRTCMFSRMKTDIKALVEYEFEF